MGWPGPATHRQFAAWQAWLAGELNRPSRADHYAMRTALEIRRLPAALFGGRCDAGLDEFRVTFGPAGAPEGKLTREEAAARSRAAWRAAMGMTPRTVGPKGG